jgi:hypothetical protein
MKGAELVRKVRKLGKEKGQSVEVVAERGKGSHSTLYYGGPRSQRRAEGRHSSWHLEAVGT